MRFTRPPFYSFIFILLVGLLASGPLSAQKKFSLPNINFGMPHFKPLFKKDSTNKIFNPNYWFKYKKEQSYTKNENAMPIAVGYTDFDENIRDLQLLGKLPTDNSLTIRPYILPKSVTYDSLLKAIDPSIVNNGHLVHKKHFDLQLLPVNILQKYNSHHPYGWNDGPLSFSKGYQYLVSGGVYMNWRNIHLTLRPEYFQTASDNYEKGNGWGELTPKLNKLILGQSNMKIDIGPISFGIGTNNMWRGPGIINSLILTNNSQGFEHFDLSTIKPIKTFFGNFELSLFAATLSQNANQGFENKFLKTSIISLDKRYINMLTITYKPFLIDNFYIGANRLFHQFNSTNIKKDFKKDYLPVLQPLFRNVYQDNSEAIDQYLSGFIKFLFPKSNMELYFEYGWNDGFSNMRDLLLNNSHSSASIIGFKKIQKLSVNKFLNLEIEATRLSQTPSYLQRDAGNWYTHGQLIEGLTNENQILGSGVGSGNNCQNATLSYNNNWNKFGILFQHISYNSTGNSHINLFKSNGGAQDWDDYSFGIITKFKFKKILFNLNTQYIKSNNYLWKEGNNVNNLYLLLNSIYIW